MNDDFLATAIRYYSYHAVAVARASAGCKDDDYFAEQQRGVEEFLKDAVAVDAAFRQQCQSALADVEGVHALELTQRANDAFAKVSSYAAELLPRIESKEPLPKETLQRLNACIAELEARYAAISAKSDILPDTLLNAEPGSKLYPGLLKKVEAICKRELSELQKRESENFRALLQKGDLDTSFDASVAQFAAERARKLEEVVMTHQDALMQSDHRPLTHEVQPGASGGALRVLTWNTLEFPSLSSGNAVQDGIQPYCRQMLRRLERERPEEIDLLLHAMTSLTVIAAHAAHVEKVLVDALSADVDVAFLQELNQEVAHQVQQRCTQKGWAAVFSEANEDSSKCNAITSVISTSSFDEERQVTVQVGKKKRYFAAARRASTWFVSCHVPIVNVKTCAPQEDEAVRVLEQLCSELQGESIVAAGDWNAKVYEVAAKYEGKDKKPSMCAPRSATCFDRDYPIDGIFCMT